ncbi:hypothetical protein ACQP2Y_21460 [Actinoplanes sp. CA-051413]|uniref:hypothetical protein n=1 Tax=Actinoplanes sp. CA-051413 TaxID=3239899 RepID=UPI003D95F4B0
MTGAEWGVIIVGTLGGLSGLGALLQAVFGRDKNKADVGKANAEASTVITNTAMEWIDKFERQAEAAQEQADRAQRQARELQVQMDAMAKEARALAEMLKELRAAILHPNATVENLRLLISHGSHWEDS